MKMKKRIDNAPYVGWRRAGSLALRATLALIFTAAASMKFAAIPFEVAAFQRFGYPLWFMYATGALQLLGAALLFMPAFTGAGAVLLAMVMVGAVGSHWQAGDPVVAALPPLVLLIPLVGLAYARRAEFAVIMAIRHADRARRQPAP